MMPTILCLSLLIAGWIVPSQSRRFGESYVSALSTNENPDLEALEKQLNSIDEGFFSSDKHKARNMDGLTDAKTLMQLFEAAKSKNPFKIAFRMPVMDADGQLIKKSFSATGHAYKYKKYTWQEFYNAVVQVAASLIKLGLKPMDAVNIRGVNSPEWMITFYGCLAAGGLPVGLYPTDSPEAMEFKAKDSGAMFVVLGKAKDADLYAQFIERLPEVKGVVLWDTVNAVKPSTRQAIQESGKKLMMFEELMNPNIHGHYIGQAEAMMESLKPGQAATVVYTSGTTGNPKGVLLSHDSLTWSCNQAANILVEKEPSGGEHRAISYLPLNHIAGQMLDVVSPLYFTSRKLGEYATTYFPATCFLKKTCFKEQLADAQPTTFLGVPEVWDGLKLKVELAARSSKIAGFFKKNVPSVVLKSLGLNKVKTAVSGAGPITKSTINFFKEMGINILNIYGQSESSAIATGWSNADFKIDNSFEKFGSIGKPFGSKLRFRGQGDEDGQGEMQLKGRNIMLGYMNRPDKTLDAITSDGWLRTGDVAKQDTDGFVFLTGRAKEIMKDKSGEMIAPVAVEEGIKEACNKPGEQILKQVVVEGDGRHFIIALFTLVEEVSPENIPTGDLAGFAKQVDPAATTVEAARTSSMWASRLTECISAYNEKAAKSQQKVFRYLVLPKDITAESSPDLMTPTFKIKRTGVSKTYNDQIEACYPKNELGDDQKLPARVVEACPVN